jgi:hypothetical protein
MTSMQCKYCRDKFDVKLWSIKNGWGQFCSRRCHYDYARSGETVACNICGTNIYRTKKQLRCSKSGKFFCSKSCQTKWRNVEFSGIRHKFWKDGSSTYRNIMIKAGVLQVCAKCSFSDKRVLAVHHKDQNRKNYNLDNLMWLCHNCHYLVHKGRI